MGKPVTITLCVSASALYNANPQPANQTELDVYCVLSDDNSGIVNPAGSSVNNFTSQVFDGNRVTWNGSNCGGGGYRVLITEVSSDNTSFFTENPLTGNGGSVTGTVNSNMNGAEDTYTIYFSIDPPGNDPAKPYQLDPKLGGNG